MIRHIVIWTLKEDLDSNAKEEVFLKMKQKLEGLQEVLQQIKEIHVGYNKNPQEKTDVILNSLFETLEDVKSYAVSKEHLEVADFIKSVVSQRTAIDYEV